MKTAIMANTVLLAFLVLLLASPIAGAAFMGAVVSASKRNPRLRGLWVRYYRQVTRWEYRLLKGGAL